MEKTRRIDNPAEKSRQERESHALPCGYMLGGYHILRLLSAEGGAFNYLAAASVDGGETRYFSIKELFPELAARHHGLSVDVSSFRPCFFEYALQHFTAVGDAFKKCRHSSVLSIVDGFRYNNTAYLVAPYLAGQSLRAVCEGLQNEEQMEHERIRRYIEPIQNGLEDLHSHSVFHCDVNPLNIFIPTAAVPLLLDPSCSEVEVMSKCSRDKVITSWYVGGYSGFVPLEQYYTDERMIGPWTDIYSLGAVIHYLINPKGDRSAKNAVPPNSVDRLASVFDMQSDPYQPLASQKHLCLSYSKAFLEAVDWALAADFRNRPQTISEWRRALFP